METNGLGDKWGHLGACPVYELHNQDTLSSLLVMCCCHGTAYRSQQASPLSKSTPRVKQYKA